MRAATTDEVITCHGWTSSPNPWSWPATTPCMREELFVVYSIVMPSRSASVMLALACGTGCLP